MSESIEKKVLEVISPSKDDRKKLEETIQDLKKQVNKEITRRKLPASIEIVGSTAKDTYLKNNLDIDLFIRFPTTFSKENIGRNALETGRKILEKPEGCYAEHPYIRGYFKGYKAEIVPCYKIEKATQKLSAVDRTPLHTKYVKTHLKEPQKQEVRLFKQFLRGIGCYGAEAEIEGFSGYLCEILIIKYGSFEKLIKNVKNWKIKYTITLTKTKHPTFDTPLVFIDPVDNNRNVASAVSKEKYELFIKACRDYLKKPRVTFFFPNKIKSWSLEKIKSEIKKQKNLYLGVKIVKPDIIAENLYPQIRKATRSIWDVCERYNFTINDVTFYVNKNTIFIIIKTKKEHLSKTMVHEGPPIKLEDNVEEFINKWKNNPKVTKKPYKKNGRYYVEIKREYIDIRVFLKEQIKNLSLGKHIDEYKQKYEVVELKDLLKNNLRGFWTAYLDKKKSWDR